LSGERLGDAAIRFRAADGDWRTTSTVDLAKAEQGTFESSDDGSQHKALYSVSSEDGGPAELSLRTKWTNEGGSLAWKLTLVNLSDSPIEVSDLSLPLPVSRTFESGERDLRILKHSFISGHNSFLFWMRQ
jgi:hypothetical protein